MRSRTLATVAAVAICVQIGNAEALPRLTQISDGVYVYEHIDPTKHGVTVNNLVVVTTDGVLVADGQGTVENTKALVSAIAGVTAQPIKFVVVGSTHGDHRGGDAAFPTTTTFLKDRRDLTLGGREIHILMLGRAHTGSDLEVWLPGERVLYMSEAFSNRVFPSMANSYPTEWVAALKSAEAMNARTYVPAHAATDAATDWQRDWTAANLRTYRLALEHVIGEGRRLHDARVAVDDAPAKASWGSFADWIRRPENAAAALKRVYLELDGGL